MSFIADIFIADQDRRAQTKAADKASAASTAASKESLALQKSMFDTLWQGTAVQRAAGEQATRMMAALMGLTLPSEQGGAQPALAQAYPTGQQGGSVSYAGRAPRTAIERQVAAFSPDGMIYDGVTTNALDVPTAGTGQYGRADLVGEGPAANALDPTGWLRSTPGYQFNFDEGARALNTRLAGQGRLQSGDASREAVRYGQNFADRTFTDNFNRLGVIAGAGQVAQSQGQQAGQNYVNNGQQAIQWNGQNQMQSSYNKGNALSGFWGAVQGSLDNAENIAMRFAGGF